MALSALVVQEVAIRGPLGSDDLPRRILIVLSYLLAAPFIAFNIRRPGIAIMGVGLVLNFLAIITNGGLMPITPDTLSNAGYTTEASLGEWVPGTKDVLLEREDTHLAALSDWIVWDDLPTARAFSIGDVIIVTGLALTLVELLMPRWRREIAPAPAEERDPDRTLL